MSYRNISLCHFGFISSIPDKIVNPGFEQDNRKGLAWTEIEGWTGTDGGISTDGFQAPVKGISYAFQKGQGGWIRQETGTLIEAILLSRRHPQQGFRSCVGILRLAKRYGDDRLEAAAGRANAIGARSYRSVASILENGLDRQPLPVCPACCGCGNA